MTATAIATAATAMLDLLDDLLGPIDIDVQVTEGRDRQAAVILESAVTHAIESFRAGRPGYARFQLAAARFRAQRVLDGTVPTGGAA